ncbi:MAG: hypothetical protein SGI83_02785 [Bacteroidota bacterium]|nr:hypothetical protein [Bacteroidota bacterium]
MKKISFLSVILFSVTVAISAQAYESTIQYDKKKQTAISIDYGYPSKAVENAIVQRMEKLGYRAREEKGILNRDKGFLVFKNAYVTDITDVKIDYIIKVERKSRKESDETVLYMILAKDGDNAINKLPPADITSAKSYLNNLLPDIEAANLELNIKAQEEVVAKAEKKLQDLKDDQLNLERKLQENKTGQEATQKDIEAQKQALGTLIGKRNTN